MNMPEWLQGYLADFIGWARKNPRHAVILVIAIYIVITLIRSSI